MNEKSPSITGSIIVGLLFGAPSVLLGLTCVYFAFEEYDRSFPDTARLAGYMFGGFVFLVIGFAIVYGLLKDYALQKNIATLKSRHPGQPGMHRPDWAKGSIASDIGQKVTATWIFAIIWNGMCAPGVYALTPKLEQGDYEILVLTPLVFFGGYLLYQALKATFRWFKLGSPKLCFTPPGAKPGQTFTANIKGNIDLPANSSCEITLLNSRQETVGSGKHRRVKTHTLYEETKIIETQSRNLTVGLPVSFLVPAQALTTDLTDSDNKVIWEIKVKTPLKGADFEAEYHIPVYP